MLSGLDTALDHAGGTYSALPTPSWIKGIVLLRMRGSREGERARKRKRLRWEKGRKVTRKDGEVS